MPGSIRLHELSLCMNLVEQLSALCRRHGARSVARVEVEVGMLSGVEALLLEDAFPFAAAASLAAGAQLVTTVVPPRIRCRNCGEEAEAAPSQLGCPACASFDTELVRGHELSIARVELVRDDPPTNGAEEKNDVH